MSNLHKSWLVSAGYHIAAENNTFCEVDPLVCYDGYDLKKVENVKLNDNVIYIKN